MITIKTMKQIPTAKVIPSFRSAGRLPAPGRVGDRGRQVAGYTQMLAQELHRQWRHQVWQRK